MHNLHASEALAKSVVPITDWIRPIVLKNLPNSTSDSCKIVSEFIRVQSKLVEMVDSYSNYVIPNRYTAFEEQIAYQIKLLASPFRMNPYTDYSPFVPRKREVATTNPSLTGQSSTSSATGSTSSSCDENPSTDDETVLEFAGVICHASRKKEITFDSVLSSMQDVYGMEMKRPTRESQKIYKSYVQIGRKAKGVEEMPMNKTGERAQIERLVSIHSKFTPENYQRLMDPLVDSQDMKTYAKYIAIPDQFSKGTLVTNKDILERYLNVTVN